MSAVIPSLSVSPAVRAHPAHAVAAAERGAQAQTQAQSHSQSPASGARQSEAAQPAWSGGSTGAVRLTSPLWPGPAAVNLPTELLGLTRTAITYTATIALPETGADFWDMLATALPGSEHR